MSKFLELREGFSICKEEVEAIEKIDDFNTRIYFKSSKIEVKFPYSTLLQILNYENPTVETSKDKNK